MKFGLDEKNWNLVEELALKPLKSAGATVWIYGSRARGDHQKFSDMDLLISQSINSKILSRVREDLEESTLPIRVDIVFDGDLAESYRPGVDRDKIRI